MKKNLLQGNGQKAKRISLLMFWVICYIFSYYEGDDYTQQVMRDFADYIKQEMLSHQLVSGVPEHGVYAESFKLSGHALRLGVKKRLLKA